MKTTILTALVFGSLGTVPAGEVAEVSAPAGSLRFVAMADGTVLDDHRGDVPANPASLVKIATTLWALETLGPDHRFETRFLYRGSIDAEAGAIDGELLVQGSADPDFHLENAWLVARELNRQGIRRVRGPVLVDDRFWIGWEGGSERKESDPGKRADAMAGRLRDAMDESRRNRVAKKAIIDMKIRRNEMGSGVSLSSEEAGGGAEMDDAAEVLAVHGSNPLLQTLKRFNAWSNNDIERLGATLGGADELATWTAERIDASRGSVKLETLSGLGTNRLSARDVVKLLLALRETTAEHGSTLADVLPLAGCDPGTLESFPGWIGRAVDRSIVAKTGTLTTTDGGVTALAGMAYTGHGEIFFCLISPGTGKRYAEARRAQEAWVLELIERHGGARPRECGEPTGHSDDHVRVLSSRCR